MDLEMVAYLAELGKLHFSQDELQKMADEMTNIIEVMDTVKEIDVTYDALADNKNISKQTASPLKRFYKMQCMMKTAL